MQYAVNCCLDLKTYSQARSPLKGKRELLGWQILIVLKWKVSEASSRMAVLYESAVLYSSKHSLSQLEGYI